jgi:hypothetical protein
VIARGVLTLVLVAVTSVAARAQDPAPEQAAPFTPSQERIRAALQQQAWISASQNLFAPAPSHDFHLGPLTFVSPDTRGQFVAVKVPIGELAMSTVHSVAAARQRRAERAAHAEVVEALARFHDARAK